MTIVSNIATNTNATATAAPSSNDNAQRSWRLLQIEQNLNDALQVELLLREELSDNCKTDHVESVAAANDRCKDGKYDAVLLSFPANDHAEIDWSTLQELTIAQPATPVLVLLESDASDENASDLLLEAGRHGASGFLDKTHLNGKSLRMALQKAIRTKGGNQKEGFAERRCEDRFELEVPVVVFPILPDGLPGSEMLGTTVDISQGGIGLRLEQDSELVPNVCLIGVENPDGKYRFAAVEWRHRRLALPGVRFGGRFLTRSDDPFSDDKLMPRLDTQSLQIEANIDRSILHEWANRGVLRSRRIDRVKACPRCESLPTFRDGCLECGSAPVTAEQLVHHFACAHVGPLEDFGSGELHCPKCQAQNLVVGADFEYLDGPVRCCECDWNDTEPALIGECLRCGHRFAGNDAVEKDVLQYHVERLDPLAFIPDAS